MDRSLIDRRHFLTVAGTLAAVGGPGGRAADGWHDTSEPEDTGVVGVGGVVQAQLPDTGYTCSRQEGGKTVMAGTFTAKQRQVLVDVDIAATFGGWGGGYFDFHIGVLPAKPPVPWEAGGKNRIVKANNESRTPLPGVTEYRHFPIGIVTANAIAARTGRRILLDGLTIGRVYQWELRSGGLSFFKLCTLEEDAQPMSLAVTPDNLFVWVACEGNNRLALLQLGWAELWPLYGYSQEMLCVADVQLGGKPGGIGLQSKGPYLATVDSTHNQLVIVNSDALTITGSYTPPSNALLSAQRVFWTADGSKVYVGGAADGKLHCFDLARREFDQATVIDPASRATIILLALSDDGRYLWCSSYQDGKIFRVDLHPAAPEPTLVYASSSGTLAPACAAVRKSDGSLVFPDTTHNLMLHVSAEGKLLGSWSIAVPGQPSPPAHCSVHLDADEVRAFWTYGGGVGWAWIDSAEVINSFHSGPATQKWFPDKRCGDIALTADEGTLIALPSSHKIIQWPGGTIRIRPSKNDPTVFGSEYAHVTFTGAEATNE